MMRLQSKEALDQASRCVDEGKLGEAAELCAGVLRSTPRNARAFYIRAAVLRKEGKGEEAVEAACEAARLRPDLPSVVLAAGYMLRKQKCFARALALFRTGLQEDPSNAQYHLGAASALRKLGRGEEATTALLKAAEAAAGGGGRGNPSDAQRQAHVQYKLAQHLRSRGDTASCVRAAAAYGRCLELDPGHALAGFWLLATRKLAAVGGGGGGVLQAASRQSGNAADSCNGNGNTAGAETTPQDRAPPAEDPPSAAPREYVVGLYNAYAETFDAHLQEALEYRTPSVIVESLKVLFPGRRYRRCLDLGCGTGLSGQAASSLVVCGGSGGGSNLVGVDLSPAMVRRAKEKRVYGRLLVGDVTETVERLRRDEAAKKRVGGGAGAGAAGRGWEAPAAPEEEGGAAAAAGDVLLVAGEGEEGETLPTAAEPPAAAAPGSAPPAAGGEGVAPKPASEGVAKSTATVTPPCSSGRSNLCTAAGASASAGAASSTGGRGDGDLVISCDVFGYIGDLRACFKAVHELVAGDGSFTAADPLEPGAIFAFSAEAPPATSTTTESGDGGADRPAAGERRKQRRRPGYELQGTGRYTHSREYLEAVCRDAGFRVLVADEMMLRKNAGVPVRGFVFITEAVLL